MPGPPTQPVTLALSLKTSVRPAKAYVLHNDNGGVYVPREDLYMVPCHPADKEGAAVKQDGIMRWLEAYAASLLRGHFAVVPFLSQPLPWGGHPVGINLYPRDSPMCAVAVTHDVRILASAMYVPEKSRKGQYFFTYCMRMSMVGNGPPAHGASGKAQLLSRHLVFDQGQGQEPLIVDGEGVIGEYPLLFKDGSFQGGEPYTYAGKEAPAEYTYASCTHIPQRRGSMMGSFKFVPGSLEKPTGAPFDVSIPQIQFIVPDFL
jgi:F-box protein 3